MRLIQDESSPLVTAKKGKINLGDGKGLLGQFFNMNSFVFA